MSVIRYNQYNVTKAHLLGELQVDTVSVCDDTGYMSRSETLLQMFRQGELNQLLNQYKAERNKFNGVDIPPSVLQVKNLDKIEVIDELSKMRQAVKQLQEYRKQLELSKSTDNSNSVTQTVETVDNSNNNQ